MSKNSGDRIKMCSDEQIRQVIQAAERSRISINSKEADPNDMPANTENLPDVIFNIPENILFKEHVLPILERISEVEGMNSKFLDPFFVRKLALSPKGKGDGQDLYAALRRNVYNSFINLNLPPFYKYVLTSWVDGSFMNDYSE